MSLDWCAQCRITFRTEVTRNKTSIVHLMAEIKWLARTGANIVLLTAISRLFAQSPPLSPDRPWHSFEERQIVTEVRRSQSPALRIESDRVYSLAELIDLAEAHNPETRVAWEGAIAQGAAVGIARSELFPTLTSVALAGVERDEAPFGTQFYRQTLPAFELTLNLNYTIFDFGARRGRINAESARLLASNFEFNDVHRQLIYEVSQAYYRLLDAAGQEEAAGASLVNAQAVQQAAEERLRNGLATLPDVLEARSATAQAQYNLQAVLGAEEIARGDLATALGATATTRIRVQPLSEVPTPESVSDTVEEAILRALEQRPDLQAQGRPGPPGASRAATGAGRLLSQPKRERQPERTIALSPPADTPLGTYRRLDRGRGAEPELDGF